MINVTASSNSKHVGRCSPRRKCAIIKPDARDHNILPPGTAPTHHMLALLEAVTNDDMHCDVTNSGMSVNVENCQNQLKNSGIS